MAQHSDVLEITSLPALPSSRGVYGFQNHQSIIPPRGPRKFWDRKQSNGTKNIQIKNKTRVPARSRGWAPSRAVRSWFVFFGTEVGIKNVFLLWNKNGALRFHGCRHLRLTRARREEQLLKKIMIFTAMYPKKDPLKSIDFLKRAKRGPLHFGKKSQIFDIFKMQCSDDFFGYRTSGYLTPVLHPCGGFWNPIKS